MRQISHPATGEVYLYRDDVEHMARMARSALERDLADAAALMAPRLAVESDPAQCAEVMHEELGPIVARFEAAMRAIADDSSPSTAQE